MLTSDGFVDVFDCVWVKGSSRSFWFGHDHESASERETDFRCEREKPGKWLGFFYLFWNSCKRNFDSVFRGVWNRVVCLVFNLRWLCVKNEDLRRRVGIVNKGEVRGHLVELLKRDWWESTSMSMWMWMWIWFWFYRLDDIRLDCKNLEPCRSC